MDRKRNSLNCMGASEYKNEFEKIINRDYFSQSLHPFRKEAFAQFKKTGFPTQKWENWRFTNLSTISKGYYKISESQDSLEKIPHIDQYTIDNVDTIVIYNGHFQKKLSSIPNGIKLLNSDEYIKRKKGKFITANNSPFDLFNTAFTDIGISLIVENNTKINTPVRILFISDGEKSIMTNPRVNLDIAESSSLVFIEHHVGNAKSFFENKSVFITLENNACLNHICIKSNSQFTQNIDNLNVKQLSNSKYNYSQFINGGKLVRNNIMIDLEKPNANCNVNCLALSSDNEHFDNNFIVNHNSHQTHSTQFVKSILFGSSSGVFNGRSVVKENAQQITAFQSNKNLLLSNTARMNSNPQLEIYADDVKCSHASTTGKIDENALFYLQSRGINKKDAVELMVTGFAKEILNNIPYPNIKMNIESNFTKKLERLMA